MSDLTLTECEAGTLKRLAMVLHHMQIAQLGTRCGLTHDDIENAARIIRQAMRRLAA